MQNTHRLNPNTLESPSHTTKQRKLRIDLGSKGDTNSDHLPERKSNDKRTLLLGDHLGYTYLVVRSKDKTCYRRSHENVKRRVPETKNRPEPDKVNKIFYLIIYRYMDMLNI